MDNLVLMTIVEAAEELLDDASSVLLTEGPLLENLVEELSALADSYGVRG